MHLIKINAKCVWKHHKHLHSTRNSFSPSVHHFEMKVHFCSVTLFSSMHRIRNLFHKYNIISSVSIFHVRFHYYNFPFYWIAPKAFGWPCLTRHFRSPNSLLFNGMRILQMVCCDHFVDHFVCEIEKFHLKLKGTPFGIDGFCLFNIQHGCV